MFRGILIIKLIFVCGLTFSETLTYQALTGKNTGISKIIINPVSDGYEVKFTGDGSNGILEGNTDTRFAQTNWVLQKDVDGTDIYAQRINNELSIKGTFKGKKFEKVYKLDNSPWTEFWGLILEPFARSNEREFYFWSLPPNDLNMIAKFKAIKLGEEKIYVNGEKVDAIHVKITLTGMLEAFFTGHYWFRKSDGKTVLEEIPQGPGAPATRIELIKEE